MTCTVCGGNGDTGHDSCCYRSWLDLTKDNPLEARYIVRPCNGWYEVYDRQLGIQSQNIYSKEVADALAADLNKDVAAGKVTQLGAPAPTTVGVFTEEDIIWLQFGLHIVLEAV